MQVKLRCGREIQIDERDAPLLDVDVINWTANHRYVMKDGQLLHRVILGLSPGDGLFVDHINGDGFDNRRENLRICRHQDNIRNRKRNINNTSGFKGVSLHRQSHKWVARIKANGTYKSLGLYASKELAHEAYKRAAVKYYGEYARFA